MPPVTHNTSLLQAISNLINQPSPAAQARARPAVGRAGGSAERVEAPKAVKAEHDAKAVRGRHLAILV